MEFYTLDSMGISGVKNLPQESWISGSNFFFFFLLFGILLITEVKLLQGDSTATLWDSLTFVQLTLVLATLCTPILKPDLNPRLAQTESLAEFFPHERVGVMGLVEQPLQLGQLLQREVRSGSSLLPVPVPAVTTVRPCRHKTRKCRLTRNAMAALRRDTDESDTSCEI